MLTSFYSSSFFPSFHFPLSQEELLQRHQHEATSLYAMQRLDWELRMQDLKMWDLKVGPKITTEHVPMVSNRDFDLLPHVRHV